MVKTFSDLRPISLSTFMNKVISKIIQGRIEKVHHKIVLHNQTGFMKGRSILQNALLARAIVRDINKRAKLFNMVVKLDMTKAYDRVSWIFLTKVMKRFGFGERIIDMVWRIL